MRKMLVSAALATLAVPAHAEWMEAQSDHFVVYANDSKADLQRFSEILERYHAAITLISGRKVDLPSPSNRVTIYVVPERKIEQLTGGDKLIAGFYIPRAGGSVAFVPDIRWTGTTTDFSLIVMLHEYAHHFMIASSRAHMPRWLSEGAAEFFASSRFLKDGTVQIGMPAYHRGAELAFATDVPVEQLLDNKLYEATRGKTYDAFYGRAWALFHYLHFDTARKGQLRAYWNDVASGTGSREAAIKAFGDLKLLQKDLDAYLKLKRILNYKLPPAQIAIGPVAITPLSAGMGAVLPWVATSKRGVDNEEAKTLLTKVRAVSAKYPDDPGVLSALAEAEHDAGNMAEAVAAADRALKIDPKQTNALVQKGYALFALAGDAEDSAKAYTRAMAPFMALNALENDHPLPLIYLYRSFADRGEEPPEKARAALERAAMLAPFDRSLAMNAAMMLAQEGKIELAIGFMKPVAADPHGGKMAAAAHAAITALSAIPEGSAVETSDLAPAIETAESAPIGEEPGAD